MYVNLGRRNALHKSRRNLENWEMSKRILEVIRNKDGIVKRQD